MGLLGRRQRAGRRARSHAAEDLRELSVITSYSIHYTKLYDVSFFINSPDRRYNRFVWDAIGLLARDATLEQNQNAVRDFFLRWHGQEAAESDFLAYLDGQKTFAELVTSGVRSYGDKDLETAYKSFSQALTKNA